MQIGRTLALILSMSSMWLASSATDWRYVPWGTAHAKLYFGLALFELAVSFVVIEMCVRKTGTLQMGYVLSIVAVALGSFIAIETVYWLANDEEYRILFRQIDGLMLWPVTIIAAIIVLRYEKKPTATADRTATKNLQLGAAIWGIGIILSIVLLAIRHFALGNLYYMLQTIIFALLTTSFATGAAVGIAAIAAARSRK